MQLLELPTRKRGITSESPSVNCYQLLPFLPEPLFLPDDWNDVARSFVEADHCFLSQGWRHEPEEDFQSARASVGWDSENLWVYAELFDDDIFNSADGLNQNTWQTGDVFEIFLRPDGAETYFEFHVTPENHVLQLRWPDADTISTLPTESGTENELQPFLLNPKQIQTWTHINREQKKWRVLVALDWKLLERRPISGETWAFSFSRYDVSRERGTTILSSSSPHQVARFHRQQEWGTLTFVL